MTRAGARRWLSLSLALLCGCARGAREHEDAELPDGVVARVGDLDIAAASVAAIAQARGEHARAALDSALRDALYALELGARRPGSALVSVSTRSAHARALLQVVEDGARAKGPPSDAEIATLREERWTELDRPVTARTTHAVVVVAKPEQDAEARALAERMASVLQGVRDPAGFQKRVAELPRGSLDVKAERLPAITADGRVYLPEGSSAAERSQRFDADFSRAAHSIAEPGELSPVVKTRFGYHVILLEERLPAQHVPLEEQRGLLAEEAIARRARADLKALLAELRERTSVEVSRSADDLTSRVPVAP